MVSVVDACTIASRGVADTLEIAGNFKDHGNELYIQKSYKEAVKSYTEGLEAAPVDFDLRISLLNNRAASNLFLKNYGAVLKDAGVVIALCTKDKKPVPIKALFRAGKALLALERWKEAKDVVDRGKLMASEKDRKDWETLEKEIESGWRKVVERAERIRREKLGKAALQTAIVVSHTCLLYASASNS
jgi:tetratricopeptide (TPR) repeat protein